MKKNLQQKKFLVTLLALCLSMGAKAQGELIDLETYPLDLRAAYPTEMMYDKSEGAVHQIKFGSWQTWWVKQNEPDTYTYHDPGMEGMEEGITWTLDYICENEKEYTCHSQGADKYGPFMIIGDKDRALNRFLRFTAPINHENAFVSDVSISISSDTYHDQTISVELWFNDEKVEEQSAFLHYQGSPEWNKETFTFDINKYGAGTVAIKINSTYGLRVYDITYIGTTKPFVEVLTTDYQYASMYYSEFDLITPEKAAYTIEGSGATVESSEAPVPATYVYNAGTGMLEETTTYAPGEIIPRGTAVVVKGTPGCVYRFYVASPTAGNPKPHNGSHLKGTDKAEETTGGTYYYALSLNPKNEVNSVGFYWMNWSYIEEDGKSIVVGGKPFINGAHKAYLALDEQPAGHEIKNHFLFNEISSGIENVEQEEGVKTIYNLAGQRLTKMQKGINIVNGKKVLVK